MVEPWCRSRSKFYGGFEPRSVQTLKNLQFRIQKFWWPKNAIFGLYILDVTKDFQAQEEASCAIQRTCISSKSEIFIFYLFIFIGNFCLPGSEFGFGILNPDLLRIPKINSQPGGPVRQPYLTYRPARLHRLEESIPGLLKTTFTNSGSVPLPGSWGAPAGAASLLPCLNTLSGNYIRSESLGSRSLYNVNVPSKCNKHKN